MCVVAFSLRVHPEFPLVLAANRDEFYDREAAPIHWWGEPGRTILAGKDLRGGGTWMGLAPATPCVSGGSPWMFAALTNFRDPRLPRVRATSRGELVVRFLEGGYPARKLAEFLHRNRHAYSPYSILFGSTDALFAYCNVTDDLVEVAPGVHGLSNHVLDTPWPKVRRAKAEVGSMAGRDGAALSEASAQSPLPARGWPGQESGGAGAIAWALLAFLDDRAVAPESELPDTGVGLDAERALSPLHVHIPERGYGTRCSTVLIIDAAGSGLLVERTHDRSGAMAFETAHLAPSRVPL